MSVRRMALSPAPTVPASATIADAVRAMEKSRGGAVVVMDGGRLAGILSERDVMLRVVCQGRDPKLTRACDVMTSHLETIDPDVPVDQALARMVSRHIRHLPVVDPDGRLIGLVSFRDLVPARLAFLEDQMRSLEAFLCCDGPGG